VTDAWAGQDLPVGTVTFLRTDVEGSMGLARRLGDAWDELNERHLAIIRRAIEAHGGRVVRTEGDAVFGVFPEAGAAVSAAVESQRGLATEAWPEDAPIRVRMGLHSGEAHRAGDDYGGFEVNRAARVAAAGHGGQILLSAATTTLVADRLPDGARLVDLGEHRLRDVPRPERLAQLSIVGLPDGFPPLRTGGPVTGVLPDRVTSFLGRNAELAAIRELLRTARLITITGPGGIGKTSLALEAARQGASDFPDGAWFVPLADVDDPEQVIAAIARGIGLYDGPERSAATALLPYVAERRLLLVLDNVEHLLEAAQRISTVVRASPGSRFVVTSRAPLHVAGEHELPIAPLVADGVALFVDRARAVRPGWEPGEDLAAVEDTCRLLDDLPLGIELAAARVSMLSPTVIRDRLAQRLPLPGAGPRDAPDRQRTLDGAVAWSHDLLDPERQRLLHVLAVFEGGFDLEEVEAVAGPGPNGPDRLDDLMELADRSLIVPAASIVGRVRYRMLRTIQSFALGRLAEAGEEVAVRHAHAEAYIALMARATPELYTSRHAGWLDRIGPEMANLRVAINGASERGEGELALRLLGPMWRFWQAFGATSEGRSVTEAALAMPSAPVSGVVRAWAAAAAGSLAYWQADTAAAGRWYEEQLRLAEAAGDERCVADAWFNVLHVRFIAGREVEAQNAAVEEAVARYEALGDERGAARAAMSRAFIGVTVGRVDDSVELLTEGLAAFRRLDDLQYESMALATLGWMAFVGGDLRTAASLTAANLRATLRMRDLATTTISLHTGMMLGVMAGEYEHAAIVAGAFDASCERFGVRPPADLERFIQGVYPYERIRDGLGPEAYDAAYERGTALSLEEAVAHVLTVAEAVERAATEGGKDGDSPAS
jgi:predicted ATPase/class 3 adenylate cyclase